MKLTAAKRPCASCPYRQDVPSGVWDVSEYVKLPAYDGDMSDQVHKGGDQLFMCHQQNGKLCSGWLASHGPDNLIAMRIGVISGTVDPAAMTYETDVPVWSSGAAAAAHGLADIERPGEHAVAIMDKVTRIQRRREISALTTSSKSNKGA